MTAHYRLARTLISLGILGVIAIVGAAGFHGIAQADTSPAASAPSAAQDAPATPTISQQECAQLLGVPQIGMIRTVDVQLLLNQSVCEAYAYLISRYNGGPQSQGTTGLANPKVNGITMLNPNFAIRIANLMKAADAQGVTLRINSAYRTCAGQEAVNPAGFSGKCDSSLHTKGLAVDFDYDKVETGGNTCLPADTACRFVQEYTRADKCLAIYNDAHGFVHGEMNHVEDTCNESGSSAPSTTAQQPGAGTETSSSPAQPSIIPGFPLGMNPITALTGGSGENTAAQAILKGILGAGTGAASASSSSAGLLGSIFGLLGNMSGSQSAASQPSGTTQPTRPADDGTPPAEPVTIMLPGGKEFDVISEDGTVIATSSVSAVDAINKAHAFYEESIEATVGSTTATSTVTVTVTSGDPYHLGSGTHVVVVDNTFTEASVTDDGTGIATTVPSGTGVSSSFLQSIGWNLTTYLRNLLHGLVLQ